MDGNSVTFRASYARFQITVENRDYHQLSQSEIDGGKGISQPLSGAKGASHAQNLVSDYPTNRSLANGLGRWAGISRPSARYVGGIAVPNIQLENPSSCRHGGNKLA